MSNNEWNNGQSDGQWQPQENWNPDVQASAGEQDQTEAASAGQDWDQAPEQNQQWGQGQQAAGEWSPAQDQNPGAQSQQSAGHWNAGAQPQASASDWNAGAHPQQSAGDWNAQQGWPGQGQQGWAGQEQGQQGRAGQAQGQQGWAGQAQGQQGWGGQGQQGWDPQQQRGFAPGQQQPKTSSAFGNVFDFSFKKFALPEASGVIFTIVVIASALWWLVDLIYAISIGTGEYGAGAGPIAQLILAGLVRSVLIILAARVFLEGMSALVTGSKKDKESGQS